MTSGTTPVARRGEEGFALILAILTLMVLTFLGLSLAATTSTDLQIASNYRWSRQAYYNAEAGLEAAKVYLRAVPVDWQSVLPPPPAAGTQWKWETQTPGSPAPGARGGGRTAPGARDYENSGCDAWGGGAGYGLVLSAASLEGGTAVLENRTTALGQNLNGMFTVWIRRPIVADGAGNLSDSPRNDIAIITSEGVAPLTAAILAGGSVRAQANAARVVLETTVVGASFDCESYKAMAGAGAGGAGFFACTQLGNTCGGGALSQLADSGRSGNTGAAGSAFATGAAGGLCPKS